MKEQETAHFYPADSKEWRAWLAENHDKEQSVWLLCYKMKAGVPTISWSDAVDEALCFGWIDSTRRSLDDERFIQFFTRRKPSSTWSRVNKEKVEQLIAAGRMTAAGMACIEIARQNGSWNILDTVEALIVPDDLEKEFAIHPGSQEFFSSLSKSVRKQILQWIVMAKRPETKQKRIAEIAELAARKLKPKHIV